jgi:aconitate hydratase
MFRDQYAHVFEGDDQWRSLPVPEGGLYEWDASSTYVQEPPYFVGMTPEPTPPGDISGARLLALLGDSVTTDHISPAGSIPRSSPAGKFLLEHGVELRDFNSYGARRGNHEVMMRGTFGNVRLRNEMVPGQEGDWTLHLPSEEPVRIYDAAMAYQQEGTPLIIIAGLGGKGHAVAWREGRHR